MDGCPWALVIWPRADPDVRGRFSFYPTRDDALAAAPAGEPYSVVDVSRPPWEYHPTIDEILRNHHTEVLDHPYPIPGGHDDTNAGEYRSRATLPGLRQRVETGG